VRIDDCSATTEYATKSGGREPAVVRDTDAAPQNRASFRDRRTHVHKSSGRQPAVDVGNTFAQIQARLFAEPPTVYVRVAVAFAVIVTTGGLRPPLLCCSADACRRKAIFAMHIRTSGQERRSSARRGSGMAPARAMQRMFAARRCVQTLSRGACGSDHVCSE
jgi:hypothetical protein